MSGGGGSNNVQYPYAALTGLWGEAQNYFQPTPYPNTTQAAGNVLSNIGGIVNPSTQYNAGGVVNAGNNLTNVGGNIANTGYGVLGNAASAGNQIYGQAQQGVQGALQNYGTNNAYANQALTNAFDPQQALFAQQFQRQQDQSNAVNAMSGVATTPYGAGLTQQNNQNFDIAWQQAQLANQAQGAQTASTLQSTGANNLASLLGTGASGLSSLLGAGTGAAATGAAIQQSVPTLQNSTTQQIIQDYLSYLGANTSNASALMSAINSSYGQATNMYSAEATAANQAQALQNQSTGGLGSLLGTVGGLISDFIP